MLVKSMRHWSQMSKKTAVSPSISTPRITYFQMKFPVNFFPILRYHNLWTNICQLYCVFVLLVKNYWRHLNKYHKLQMQSLSLKQFCMSCVNKHTQSHVYPPYIRVIGRYQLNFVMVEFRPISFNKPFVSEIRIFSIKENYLSQMPLNILKYLA